MLLMVNLVITSKTIFMKKLYTIMLALAPFAVATAQDDVSVALNFYTSMEATSDDPLDMVFTITNEGAGPVVTGDTVFFCFLIGSTNYSMDLTSGGVSYIVLTSDLAAGNSIDLSTLTTPPSTMDMQWIYSEMGGLNGNICAFSGVGQASLSLAPGNDANYVDNIMCVDYTVTEVAGLESVGMSYLTVFPNPANDFVNFQVGNNEISHINVFDLTGKLVTSILVNGTMETISTADFGSGVFYYQMMNGEEMVKTDKFVVAE